MNFVIDSCGNGLFSWFKRELKSKDISPLKIFVIYKCCIMFQSKSWGLRDEIEYNIWLPQLYIRIALSSHLSVGYY